MSISLCIIVKNNGATLESCLNSAKKIADEIIIVDTDSTDNTIEIAKRFTEKIYNFKNDNFSDKKNFALSKATKDWILALDADETLSEKDLSRIKELTKTNEFLGFSLIQRNYTNQIGSFGWISSLNDSYEESKIANGYTPRRMIRLFKNLPEIKFEGAVHDSVEKSILKIGKIKETDIPIHHSGFLNRNSDRVKFYIELEKKNIKNDFFQDYQLAVQLNSIEEVDEALEYIKKSLAENPIFGLSWLELGIIMLKKKNLEESQKALHEAEKHLEHPMLYNYLGVLYGFLNDFKKSEAYLEKAISLLPDNADFHYNLGLTYNSLGKKTEAFIELKKAVELNPEYNKYVKFES